MTRSSNDTVNTRLLKTLRRDSFNALLGALHPDREQASVEYERLRVRLVRFFQWQSESSAEDLADESLDRLAMKIERGEQILDLRNYLHGIARMVVRESRQRRRREQTLVERATHFLHLAGKDPLAEELYRAMEIGMDKIPAESRDLLLRYYSADGRNAGIANRERMAAELGISLNALRNRALRLRTELERITLNTLKSGKGRRDKAASKYTQINE
jgi:DNA-directed RNA polymerase specialized sigma24 family protein